jgi:hypothetical protein
MLESLKIKIKKNIILFSLVDIPRRLLMTCLKQLKRIITFPLHFGSSDAYPPTTYRFNKGILVRKKSIDDRKRIAFWSKIACQTNTFSHFYTSDPLMSFMSCDSNGLREQKLKLGDLYKNGVVAIGDFFSNEEHKLFLELFSKRMVSEEKTSRGMNGVNIHSKPDVELFNNNLAPFEELIFGRSLPRKSFWLSMTVYRGDYPYKASVNWHQDRFIPCFKCLYFPEDVKIGAFRYMTGSHIINQQYIDNAIRMSEKGCESGEDIFDFSGYKSQEFKVKGNTLVIAATHGFHKRNPENGIGNRKYITLDYFNLFSRYDLIFNYLKKSQTGRTDLTSLKV